MSDWPIELHGIVTGNSLRVGIALEETATPYALCLNSLLGEQAESLAACGFLGPQWLEPVMVDRNTRGRVIILTESTTMLYYIAAKSPGTLVPLDPDQRALVYSRLNSFLVEGIAAAPWSTDPPLTGETFNRHRTETLCTALAAGEPFVATTPFMAGADFSLVDIAAFTIAIDVDHEFDWGHHPGLCRWYEAVGSRPSIVRGLQAFVDPQVDTRTLYQGVLYRLH